MTGWGTMTNLIEVFSLQHNQSEANERVHLADAFVEMHIATGRRDLAQGKLHDALLAFLDGDLRSCNLQLTLRLHGTLLDR